MSRFRERRSLGAAPRTGPAALAARDSRDTRLAYGYDLKQREQGVAAGPESLALWRGFAWNEHGSPKPGFRLTAGSVVDAEVRLVAALQERQNDRRILDAPA